MIKYFMKVKLMIKKLQQSTVMLLNNEHLYFIVIDNKNNMFGHYFETIIHNSYIHTEHNYNYYSRIFIF